MTTDTSPRLLNNELLDPRRLVRKADSKELELMVPELAYRSTAAALGIDPLDAFFAAHAPDGVTIDDLAVLGPILVLKLKVDPETFPRPIVVEMWMYPDGSRVVELSTNCLPGEGLDVAEQAPAFLGGIGLDLSDEQQTKTKTALEFFSAELQASWS